MTKPKPYPGYKDSGVPWLGRLPEHWGVERPKWLFHKMDRPVRQTDEVVTCFRDGVVTLRKNRRVRGFTESLKEIGYQGVRRGDLVIHAMDAFAGAVGVADCDGKGTPVYSVCQPTEGINAHFYAYFLREMARAGWILALAKGIRERSTDFRFNDFASQFVPLPPAAEQSAVVGFLSHVDKRIRRFIAAKRRLIELLNEQKQAIIQKAVTRGLDPDVRFKPSGIHWLGDVPAHWVSKPAKYFLSEIDERSSRGTEELLSVSHITGVSPRSQKNITMFMAESYVGHKVCRSGDLVINTMWAWMGALGVSKQTGIVSPSYAVYRPRDRDAFVPGFLDHLLRTTPYVSEFTCRSTGIRSSRLRLYPEEFLKIALVQPSTEEQGRIVNMIEEQTRELDSSISRANREMDFIREYRTRLIADVVTGKLDVRGVELAALGRRRRASRRGR